MAGEAGVRTGDVCCSCLRWTGRGKGYPMPCKACAGPKGGKRDELAAPPHPNDTVQIDHLMQQAWRRLSLSAQLKTCPVCLKPCKSAHGVGMHLRMTHNA